MQRGTSLEHVARAGIEDRVLRNYWVTQSYSDSPPPSPSRSHTPTVHLRTWGRARWTEPSRRDLPNAPERVVLDDG